MLEWWPTWLTPVWDDAIIGALLVLIAWSSASMDIIRDSLNNIYRRWSYQCKWFGKWFNRKGNIKNNPRNIFTSDPWHAFKHLLFLFFGVALTIASGRVFYLLASVVIGIGFTFFYHNILRDIKSLRADLDYRTIRTIIDDIVHPFRNASARDQRNSIPYCVSCHREFDHGKRLTKAEREDIFCRAWEQSIFALFAEGRISVE